MNNHVDLNVTSIPKELRLMLDIIKGENDNSIGKEDYDDIDWDVFLQLALHHRLYPLLYIKIMKLENNWIPSKTIQTLSHYYRKNTFQMLHLCGEMEKQSQLLMENGIRTLFLKGPVLASDLYGDISMRTSGDLDLLISIDDLQKANELFEKQGYEKDEYIQPLLNDWKWRHHHFTYYHPKNGIKMEIHWRLNPALSKEPTFDELWERKRKSRITSFPIYYMGKEDLFYFLVTHGARHGWSRLRWLVDMHQLVKKELNWDFLTKQLKTYQCRQIGGQSLLLASQLLNTTLVKEMEHLMKGSHPIKLARDAIFYLVRMVNLHTDPVPNNIANYHARYLFSLLSFRQKFFYLLSMLHPYYTDAETLPLPKKLHFLYFPLRPFLFIWRRISSKTLLFLNRKTE